MSDSEHLLRSILAVIHGDGGHYATEHGLPKATEDAIELWHHARVRDRFRREALQALRAVFEPEPVQSCKHGYADSSRATMAYREAKQWYQENKEE